MVYLQVIYCYLVGWQDLRLDFKGGLNLVSSGVCRGCVGRVEAGCGGTRGSLQFILQLDTPQPPLHTQTNVAASETNVATSQTSIATSQTTITASPDCR